MLVINNSHFSKSPHFVKHYNGLIFKRLDLKCRRKRKNGTEPLMDPVPEFACSQIISLGGIRPVTPLS
jgi:hypothetical protein